LREGLADKPGVEVIPLWLRGRATGVIRTLGRPRRPLSEIARQAAAAIALASRYTDTFARGQRRKQPRAAAEIQQSLLPPRIWRITGGEVKEMPGPQGRDARDSGSVGSRQLRLGARQLRDIPPVVARTNRDAEIIDRAPGRA
jgi:hypothetical protein